MKPLLVLFVAGWLGLWARPVAAQGPATAVGNYWHESPVDGRLLQLIITANGAQLIDAELHHMDDLVGGEDAPMSYPLGISVPYTPKARRVEFKALYEDGPDKITAIFHKPNEVIVVLEYGPYAETLLMTRH